MEGDEEAQKKILELMQAVDDYIPLPERPVDKPFLMPVEDVFTITGRGTVVTGRVDRGTIKVNEPVEIVGIRPTRSTVVTGVEMFRKLLDYAQAGDNVGLLLRGVAREEVQRGQVIAKPKSVTPHTKFTAQVYVLSKEEGGRTPFFSNYRPQFYFRQLMSPVSSIFKRRRNGHARRQYRHDRRVNPPDRHRTGNKVLNPRRRSHRRCRFCRRNHRIALTNRDARASLFLSLIGLVIWIWYNFNGIDTLRSTLLFKGAQLWKKQSKTSDFSVLI